MTGPLAKPTQYELTSELRDRFRQVFRDVVREGSTPGEVRLPADTVLVRENVHGQFHPVDLLDIFPVIQSEDVEPGTIVVRNTDGREIVVKLPHG